MLPSRTEVRAALRLEHLSLLLHEDAHHLLLQIYHFRLLLVSLSSLIGSSLIHLTHVDASLLDCLQHAFQLAIEATLFTRAKAKAAVAVAAAEMVVEVNRHTR